MYSPNIVQHVLLFLIYSLFDNFCVHFLHA